MLEADVEIGHGMLDDALTRQALAETGERTERPSASAGTRPVVAAVAFLFEPVAALVSAADRARSGVTKAIGRALQAIRKAHESLGH